MPSSVLRPGGNFRPKLRGNSSRPSLQEQLAAPVEPRRRARPGTVRRVIMLTLMLVVVTVILLPTLRSYLDQRSQIAELRQEKASMSKTVDQLEAQKKRWDDPKYVKQQAQQRLGYAMPGQKVTIYVDRGNKEQRVTQGNVASSEALRDHPWYGKVWGSIASKPTNK